MAAVTESIQHDLTEVIAALSIDGWSPLEKLVFPGPYHLLTAYRPRANSWVSATARRAREHFRNRQSAALYRLLAVHDR